MTSIEKLVWDSEFFSLHIGKVNIEDNDLFFLPEIFNEQSLAEYDLVYIFSHQLLPNANDFDLDLVDVMITMSQPLDKSQTNKHDYTFRTSLNEREIKECYEIAEQTAEVSRFYLERLIGPEKAKALYRKWIDNAINQQYANGILIVRSGEEIAGIHVVKSVKEDSAGLCSLIGVNKKFKGHGLGKNLWQQAFGYWNQFDEITKCTVPFSIKNRESFNFHLKMGFNKIEEIKYIYHYRKN
jgi:ribosomal protein S18 acetylase RimI-like enzyme